MLKGATPTPPSSDEIDRLKAELEGFKDQCRGCGDQLRTAHHERDRYREALEDIDRWSQAYPLDMFPEPDFQKARELLEAGGITLDAVSASNMRHVVEGVGKIASKALKGKE